MSRVKSVITRCPMCEGNMHISRLECEECDTTIQSVLPIPHLFRMPPELQEFVIAFLRLRGNIREMEKELGVSYPTVCKRLDQVNQFLSGAENNMSTAPPPAPVPVRVVNPREVLKRVEKGEITAAEAAKLLREG